MTISFSLIAVFIPLLLMGGIVGRLFREFAVTLSVAILVSMVISLTTTPMMCAHLLKQQAGSRMVLSHQRAVLHVDRRDLRADADTWCCDTAFITLLVLLATIALNVYLFIQVPKGFFPEQDNGRIMGAVHGRSGYLVSGPR